MRIAFLASHNGSSAQAIIGTIDQKLILAEAVCIVSNNVDAPVLDFAKSHTPPLPGIYLDATAPKTDAALAKLLSQHKVDLVVLSGYMKKIGPQTLTKFSGKILNVHPALPTSQYKGKGFYGDKIHRAVLQNKEKLTGVMIHVVDSEYDHGIVLASDVVRVKRNDTVESLRTRVQEKEKALYIAVVKKIAEEFAKNSKFTPALPA